MCIAIKDKSQCCGCRACEQMCPTNVIKMREDEEGFAYPIVGQGCIECRLCVKVCPILNYTKELSEKFDQKVYGAYNKDEEILINSSSGGIFTTIGKNILKKEGVVYGAAYNEEMKVEHIGIENLNDLYKLRGSKYVQSDVLKTYQEVKKMLKKGKDVLYTGTPCQIAGLKRYLGKDYERLITIDLVCHGTPSPKIFSAYIDYLKEKKGKKVTEFNFRYKGEYGWGLRYQLQYNNNNKETNPAALSPYYYAFLSDMLHRPICYSCPYASEKREGDITLADFWGIEEEHPEIFNKKGTSLVIVNTLKGMNTMKEVEGDFEIVESTIKIAKKQNGNLSHPSHRPQCRDMIYVDLEQKGFKYISKKYCRPRKYIRLKISSRVPYKIKKYLKKI